MANRLKKSKNVNLTAANDELKVTLVINTNGTISGESEGTQSKEILVAYGTTFSIEGDTISFSDGQSVTVIKPEDSESEKKKYSDPALWSAKFTYEFATTQIFDNTDNALILTESEEILINEFDYDEIESGKVECNIVFVATFIPIPVVTIVTNGLIGIIGNMSNIKKLILPKGTIYKASGNTINFMIKYIDSSGEERTITTESVTVNKPIDTNEYTYKKITTWSDVKGTVDGDIVIYSSFEKRNGIKCIVKKRFGNCSCNSKS